jgi:hypothetical protein
MEKVYYNHVADVGFSVMSEDPNGATSQEIIDALKRRLQHLEAHPEEAQQAISFYDLSDKPCDEKEYQEWKEKFNR